MRKTRLKQVTTVVVFAVITLAVALALIRVL